MKKEAKIVPANRCFDGNCPKKPAKQREERAKELLLIASQKKRARKTLTTLASERRCGYAGLLKLVENWVAGKRISSYVFEELIQIVERQRERNVLSHEEIVDLEGAKASPVRQSQ
ncbi:MAG: hypothetical protein ABIJ84_00560 [bacterium]